MKRFLTILTSVIALAFVFTSCEETEEFNEFSNWKERNDNFIDSIANAVANYSAEPIAPYDAEKGDMFRILSFKLDPKKEWGDSRYVYCKVVEKGGGNYGNRCYGNTLIDNRNTVFLFNLLGRFGQMLGAFGDFIVDVSAKLVRVVTHAIVKRNAHRDGTDVKIFVTDHTDCFVYFLSVVHIAFSFLLNA